MNGHARHKRAAKTSSSAPSCVDASLTNLLGCYKERLCLLCRALGPPPDPPHLSRRTSRRSTKLRPINPPTLPFLFGTVSQSARKKKKSLCVVFGSGQFSATICLLLIALSVSPISLLLSLSSSLFLDIPANTSKLQALFFSLLHSCVSFFPKILENLAKVAAALRPRWRLATPPALCLFILKRAGRCWLLISCT